MAEFQKYARKRSVVMAGQAGSQADYGVLGNLITTDYIVSLDDGTLTSAAEADFEARYDVTNDTEALANGSIWY
jgi:hypothetical protein